VNELLLLSAKEFCLWLESKLPALGASWWTTNVVQRLTFPQQRSVQERHIDSLSRLDLAALLRILDQNWHELAAIEPLPKEARNWVKELQTVRNRWAHAPTDGHTAQDTFRDADTLARLLEIIGASSELKAKTAAFKAETLVRLAPVPEKTAEKTSAIFNPEIAPAITPLQPAHKFSVGQLVGLRSNQNAMFPVIEIVVAGGAENRYRVFENGTKQTYYESQLRELEEVTAAHHVVSTTDLSALLTSIYLSSPSAASLYSLNSGRVRFVPYQYRPVFKLIRADRPRLLIADEVGVGKTIEAGLILKELQARNDIKSVLIICPKALISERKWELEMKRFDEQFIPLDGGLLRHCIRETHLSGEWPVQYEKALLPFSLFDNDLLFGKAGKGKARNMGLLELDPAPKFDLVIVDEAHHIRNSETFLHQAVRYFADNAEAVLFLSATPVQLGRHDLFTLLNVLRPDVIIDPASFAQMAEPNHLINAAIQDCRKAEAGWPEMVRVALTGVSETAWGRNVVSVSPGFQKIFDTLAEDVSDVSVRIRTIQALEDLYTFSALINRTRRRDIGEFTTRKPETVVTDFTLNQKALHDDLLSVIARILGRLHGNQNVKFMMTTVSRQAASSLYGLAPMLENMLAKKLESIEVDEEGDDDAGAVRFDFLDEISGDIRSLIERAKRLDKTDPKADAFMKVVSDKLQMPKNKVLVFSTFRHTLAYLSGKLTAQGVRFGLVHGGIPDDDRATLRRQFALPKGDKDALDVLLSSEVGCEGLDFQFCDCLVNYDLPWNPMRIEQRIGRIDRYGQQSEVVAIFNLITPGTIDAEIYNRCLSRIGVFQHAIGGNEEILGEITRELQSISESFSLTESERDRRLEQLADNKIRQIQEEQKLEERQGELFGLNLPSTSWEEKLNESRNYWLEPTALASAVSVYLSRRLGKEQEFLLGEKALKTLRLNHEARAALLDEFRKLPHSNNRMYRNWERWLKGAVPTIQVTFDQECAVDESDAVLLSLGHPLVRQAAHFLQETEPVFTQLQVEHANLPVGEYPFAVYRWNRQGARRDEELVAVVPDASISAALFELLPVASFAPELSLPSQEVLDSLDAVHHQRWLVAATDHAEDNRQVVGVRIQSLTASHRARKTLLDEQVGQATNEKIRIMKRAELERAQADFDRRIAQLNVAADSGDIRATPIVFGVIEIRTA
jgi:superfamily II DNA or RNA helicase